MNLRVGSYELDVVARDADTVVVVEVRARGVTSWQSGFASLSATKRKRVRAAGERLWREKFARDRTANRMRFDVAAVSFADDGTPVIEYAHGVL